MVSGLQLDNLGRVSWYECLYHYQKCTLFVLFVSHTKMFLAAFIVSGEIISVSNILLGRMGLRDIGGPTQNAAEQSKHMRGLVRRLSSGALMN